MPCWGWGPSPPQLQRPSCCLSPSGPGIQPGEQGGSWAPHPPRGFLCRSSSSPLFFRSAPIKVVFPTRCCSSRPMMGSGHPAMPPVAPHPCPHLDHSASRLSPTSPSWGAAGSNGGAQSRALGIPQSLLPVPHRGSMCQGQARRWGHWAGSAGTAGNAGPAASAGQAVRCRQGRRCRTGSRQADGLPGGKRHGAEDMPRSGAVSPAQIAFPLRSNFSCQAGSLRPTVP